MQFRVRALLFAACAAFAVSAHARDFRSSDVHPADYPTVEAVKSKDQEGCYWSCGISAGRINRFSPAGELIEYIELPVTHPTMPCFAFPA